MKTLKYQKLLVTELDKIKEEIGEAKMNYIYLELKPESQEAMSREVVIQITARYFRFWRRVKFLACHRDLILPYLFRIKPTKTTTAP